MRPRRQTIASRLHASEPTEPPPTDRALTINNSALVAELGRDEVADDKMLTNGRPLSDSDGRFTNERQQFQIAAADEDDAGRYSCVAENKAGRADKDLVVAVLMPPTVHDAPTVIEIPENETQTLECPANEMQVDIQWTRNGVPFPTSDNLQLSSSGRKLHIMKAQVMNAGRYSCLVKNEAGQVSADVEVIVLVPPRIVGPGFRTIDSIVNQTVQIECRTTGIPSPQVSWTHDGRPLLANPSVELLNNGSVLRLSTIQTPQEGRYTCTAVNKIGRAEADTFVQVTAPPQISPQPEEVRAILGQGQTIRCEVAGSPPPRVEWLKNGQKFESALAHSSFDMHYIHVVEAGIDDAGRYTCIATNRAGEDRMTVQLVVLVPPTIQEGERVLNVKENTSLSLECIATGTPPPQLSWKREGETIVSNEHYQLVGDGLRLTILDARKDDAGRYTCQAKNEAGSAAADFAVDVYVRPMFRDLKPEVRVIEGERARLECKVDAHPPATIRWLRGGRPIEDMSNVILSPRGESLMILKARRTDAGSYSCVAKNAAGESEAGFAVTVLVAPHIDEQIDQNPKVVVGKDVLVVCPVQGIRQPSVEWRVNGQPLTLEAGRFEIVNDHDLKVTAAESEDAGRYTCHAWNEAGELDTDYALEVIAPPKFGREGVTVYEVIEDQSVTMDCAVEAQPKPEIVWYRGDAPVYLDQNVWISANGQELTISQARLSDGGKYVCKATNVAGTTDIDIILKVLVPPKIDKSNIIGNPLAIVNRTIFLECPVTGIPQPTVRWMKDGQPLTIRDSRITIEQNNQTLGIQPIIEADEGRYTCVAESNAGAAEQDFNLEVLTPPILETTERQKITKREGDSLTLNCPLRQVGDQTDVPDVSWTKDGRPLDPLSLPNIRISSEGRRLHVTNVVIPEAGLYTCVASNRAGESSLEFDVEVLSIAKEAQPLLDQ
uniref:Ig-like domain-containing protein n=1 Tax=Plectus sambesii TaxID=2011161 RepID=A0A914V1R3_9BILA